MENLNAPIQDSDVLIRGARAEVIPHNVPCPCRCSFCYESKFTKLFPWIKTRYIPPYTDETFNFYQKVYKFFRKRRAPLLIDSPIKRMANEFQYFTNCDFFSLGLTPKQIEILVLNCKERGFYLEVYTAGFNVDFKLIKYFSSKYPNIFKVHLSIITFDSAIRKNIMNPNINIENIKKICKVLYSPIYFLLYFNKNQVISDIEILNGFSIKNHGAFYIHKLYYNKLSPKYIIDYSNKAEREFEEIIFYLKLNDKKLKDISRRLTFSPQSKIYAWVFREGVKKLLQICKGTDDEAIFCSQGAYEEIKKLIDKKTYVVPIKSCFGGCVDFTLGITAKAILSKIKKMLTEGIALKRIYIPHSMFCIEGKYDLNCDSVNLIKKTYPKIEVNVIRIPLNILHSTIYLDDCIRYYIMKKEAKNTISV